MSNSGLVVYTKISPNSTNPRREKISKITIHHMASNLTIETLGRVFANPKREASSNYGVDSDGRIGMYVEEKNRAWTSGSGKNDHAAITIEVANCGGDPDWPVSDKALAAVIDLCVDICKRNGIKRLNFTGNKDGNLTMHKYFQATKCPGPYLEARFPYIASEVNRRLEAAEKPSGPLYRVQVGAFRNKDNALALANKLKAAGFDAYIVIEKGEESAPEESKPALTPEPTPTPVPKPEPAKTIKVGSRVRVKQGARTYTGGVLASFVYRTTYDVQQIQGDRAVIGLKGKVTAAVKLKDLILQ